MKRLLQINLIVQRKSFRVETIQSEQNFDTMEKFKVLKYNECMLFKLGIFRNQFPLKPINGFFKSKIIVYNLIVSMSFLISSLVFANKNMTDFNVTLRACSFAIGTIQASGMFISFGLNTTEIQAVHLKLQKLVDKSIEGDCLSFFLT